ncbi:hypothetical protein MRB53_038902 [Persea americana]|nr:hypothetical protein MRB53_038902 [Persea americana]
MPDVEALRANWRTLYAKTLPSLARSKDLAQKKWPVTLDHCFARIILDNTIGAGSKDGEMVQWDKVIKKPAVQNMSEGQLKEAITLGEQIQKGEVDLVELDEKSLIARGKHEGKYGNNKRKRDQEGREERSTTNRKKQKKDTGKKQLIIAFGTENDVKQEQLPSPVLSETENSKDGVDETKHEARTQLEKELDTTSDLSRESVKQTLKQIHTHSGLTPFRQRLYTSLLSVPRGHYTTYAAMAEHLGSVARAVGNGMRNNPFAPDVPCHRVLASDRSIGGFGGDWSRDGKNTEKQDMKAKLLREEGVKFDSTGKVKGPVWKAFWDLRDFEKVYGKIT